MFCLENKSICKGGFVFVLITEFFWWTFWSDYWQSLIGVVENFRCNSISQSKICFVGSSYCIIGIFSRFSQLVHFSRFKPNNLLLSTARFTGYNLEKYTGWLNLEKIPVWIHFTGTYRLIPQKKCKSSAVRHLISIVIKIWFVHLTLKLNNQKYNVLLQLQ